MVIHCAYFHLYSGKQEWSGQRGRILSSALAKVNNVFILVAIPGSYYSNETQEVIKVLHE